MGAVAGVIRKDRSIGKDEEQRIIRVLETYHSDVLQVWRKDGAFMACAHQWLTKESVGERLPFHYRDRYVIVSDALLDNRQDLFYDLGIHPSQRRYMTDTMLLVRAFERWGIRMVYRLLGSFAAAIWDRQNKQLFLFRDSSGSRTLYYFQKQNMTAFSTTKEVLLQMPEVGRKFNEEWIAQFIAIPSKVEALDMKRTVFRDIQQVPPSAAVVITEESTAVKPYSLIDPDYRITLSRDEEYEEALRSVLAESVRSKMRARGNRGSLLSGGLDSGTIASLASRELTEPLYTYTVLPKEGFEEWAGRSSTADKRERVQKTIRYAGNIRERMLPFNESHPLKKLDDHLELLETPFKSIENFFWREEVHHEAEKDSVKILLNSFRSKSTISWGSPDLNHYYYARLLRRMEWRKLNREIGAYADHFQTTRKKLLSSLTKRALRRKTQASGSMPVWIHPDLAARTDVFGLCRRHNYPLQKIGEEELSDFRKRSLMQNFHWNNEGIAGTKLSLRTGIWERDATNDYRIIQFCLAVPEEQFVKDGLERSLLRRAVQPLLPESIWIHQHQQDDPGEDIVYRMKEDWGSFCLEAEEMVREGRLAEWVDMDYIRKIAEEMPAVPDPSCVWDVRFRILSRCLVLHRFIKMHENR